MKKRISQLAHNSNGYTNVFDVKQHDWTDLITAVCLVECEIKVGGLETEDLYLRGLRTWT